MTKFILKFINLLSKAKNKLNFAFLGLAKINLSAISFLNKCIFINLYKAYLFIKRKLNKTFAPAKNKLIYPLVSKYFIHVLVIIICLGITTNNLYAYTINPSEYSQASILYKIASPEGELELIEERADFKNSKKVSLLGPSVGVYSTTVATEESRQEATRVNAITGATQGNTALIKPTISRLGQTQTTDGRKGIITYTVKEGDTISTIAQQFNVNVNTILWENNLRSNSYIKPGQKLSILPVSGMAHTVRANETISKIARTYSVDEAEILEFNGLDAEDTIGIGQKIIIPGGQLKRTTATRQNQTTQIAKLKEIFVPPSAKPTTSKMQWPTSGRVITQYYHWRHHGLDIDGDYTSPIYASESGTVVLTGWGTGYGLNIMINHGNGIKTRYAHLSKIFVKPGQQVARGQTLGMMGTTGWSTGTHLHYEVIVNGVKKNPLSYIR